MQEFNEMELFRTVLNEMLTELKQLRDGQKEMNKTILLLCEKVEVFHQRLENIRVDAPVADLQPVKDQLAEWTIGSGRQMAEGIEKVQSAFSQYLQKLTEAVATQPKPIVRRISLFPENDHHGHFKFFISRLVWGILGVSLLAALFSLGQQYITKPSTDKYIPVERYPAEKEVPVAPPAHRVKVSRRHHVVDTVRRDSVEGLPSGR